MADMNILDVELGDNDARAKTVRDYLKALLLKLWQNGESFSGKRPFGNSGWTYELYTPLVKAGLVSGQLDDDGYIITVDEDAADALILDAINSLK